MSFHQPSVWALLLLVLLPVLWWRWASRKRAAVTFSSIEPLADAGTTWAVRLRWIVPALRTLAIAGLIVCVARPQRADEHTRTFTEGIAIQLIVDRSGSMLAEDFEIDRQRVSRIEVVKQVVTDFVGGGEDLPGRPDDLIGLIAFGTFADTMCPLTHDHAHLIETIAQTNVSPIEQERATAIGDAIALGVERIRSLGDRPDGDRLGRIKSHVMILLTDGESNAGEIDPLTAAEMAAAFDIKVYTIGAGTNDAFAPVPGVDRRGRRVMSRLRVSIDEETLRAIADATGGEYFRATDSDSLEEVYARIDELERTEIEEQRFTDYRELTVEPIEVGSVRLPPLLTVVFVLLALEQLLAHTRFRRLP